VKVLVVHNFYRQKTGEDLMVGMLSRSLIKSGRYKVLEYHRYSASFHAWPWWRKIWALLCGNLPGWVDREFKILLKNQRPQLAIIHNLVPLINPWILPTLKRHGVLVIGSIYNFRLLCPRGTCVRDEQYCQLCYERSPGFGLLHNCLHNWLYSLLYVYRFMVQRRLRCYFDAFICSVKYRTDFMRHKIPGSKIFFLRHYLNVPSVLIEKPKAPTDHILFAGRLVMEKGVRLALECARALPHIRFKICGDGPQSEMCRRFITRYQLTNVELLPWQDRENLFKLLHAARLLIFPSLCLEFGLVMCEAMLLKTPVVAARNAASETVIRHGQNGFLFDPRNIETLVSLIRQVWDDRQRLDAVAAQAHDMVRPYNDLQRFTNDFEALYREIAQYKTSGS